MELLRVWVVRKRIQSNTEIEGGCNERQVVREENTLRKNFTS